MLVLCSWLTFPSGQSAFAQTEDVETRAALYIEILAYLYFPGLCISIICPCGCSLCYIYKRRTIRHYLHYKDEITD